MPWTLQYLRRRKRVWPFPALFWPIGMPWGSLLCAMTMFLMIESRWEPMAMFTVSVAMEADTSARPLAVLRMRARRAATVHYFRADRLPDIRAATVRRDIAVVPPPPLPKYLRHLQEEWVLTEDECFKDVTRRTTGDIRKAFFTGRKQAETEPLRGAREKHTEPRPPQGTRPTALLAKQYRSAIDWDGIRQALLEAKTAGIDSDLVYVEADDQADADAVIVAMDLCTTLGLRPVLRMQ
jgi:hypothetical protein